MYTEFFVLVLIFDVAKSEIEPRIVKGQQVVDIKYFAHSASLHVGENYGGYICGASILNQKILLTAAHCIENCFNNCVGFVYTGHIHKYTGAKARIASCKKHERYQASVMQNDIGLVLLKRSLKFNNLVKRIAIVRRPPWRTSAVIAGWGLIHEQLEISTDYLQYAKLKVWSYEDCRKIMSSLPQGCLCAGQRGGQTYASRGDSGSALVVDGYIEIGIVSFKRVPGLISIVAFANVSYFYDWITLNSKRLYCKKFKK